MKIVRDSIAKGAYFGYFSQANLQLQP